MSDFSHLQGQRLGNNRMIWIDSVSAQNDFALINTNGINIFSPVVDIRDTYLLYARNSQGNRTTVLNEDRLDYFINLANNFVMTIGVSL